MARGAVTLFGWFEPCHAAITAPCLIVVDAGGHTSPGAKESLSSSKTAVISNWAILWVRLHIFVPPKSVPSSVCVEVCVCTRVCTAYRTMEFNNLVRQGHATALFASAPHKCLHATHCV